MTPMRARLPHSSRLSWGRTSGAAATSPARAVAASAMGGALGVDPDAVLRQAEGDDVVLGDPEPADHVHREIGAEPGVTQRAVEKLRAEERAEEDHRAHPRLEGVRLAGADVLHHDVLRADGERHRSAWREAVRFAAELDLPESHHAVAHHGAGDEVHHADEVGDERGGGGAVDVEGHADLLYHALVHHHD